MKWEMLKDYYISLEVVWIVKGMYKKCNSRINGRGADSQWLHGCFKISDKETNEQKFLSIIYNVP